VSHSSEFWHHNPLCCFSTSVCCCCCCLIRYRLSPENLDTPSYLYCHYYCCCHCHIVASRLMATRAVTNINITSGIPYGCHIFANKIPVLSHYLLCPCHSCTCKPVREHESFSYPSLAVLKL